MKLTGWTSKMLKIIYGGPLSEKRPNVYQALKVRQEALKELHYRQISLLKEWGAGKDAVSLLVQLLSTVNAIANGLDTTG